MDKVYKKIRLSLMGILIVAIVESLLGFSSLYSGVLFSEYNQEAADETLALLQETDPAHYELIMSPDDPTYMEEFRRIYTTRGNRALTVYGIILILLSAMTAVPAIMAFLQAGSLGETATSEGESAATETESTGEEADESF